MKKLSWLLFTMILMLMIAGCSSNEASNNGSSTSNDEDKETQEGGVLNVAISSEPPTLDVHINGSSVLKDVGRNIYENLVTFDESGNIVPDLAESFEVSEDGLTYSFKLREGIKFHNGKELTADDVVASLNRWIKLSSPGKTNFQGSEFVKVDDYNVELHIPSPNINTPALLADPIPAAAIYPKEVVESAEDTGVKEYIGTGPFKLKEWKQNQSITVERFEDYSSEGRGIAKEPKLDEIVFSFITDESTRISGLSTGQFHVSNISSDNVQQIEGLPDVSTELSPGGFMGLFYNNLEGISTDLNFRKAVNAALNMDDILIASYGNPEFYELTSSIVNPQYPNYYSEAGKEEYNQNDPEKAKEYLAQSNYNGEEIILLTSRDNQDQYNSAVVIQQQLEAIGIKTKLEVYDWATFQEKWADPAAWDILTVAWASRSTIFQGFWGSDGQPVEESVKYLDKIKAAPSVEEARTAIDETQSYVWDQLPFTVLGHRKQVNAISNKIAGYQYNLGPVYYNISLTK
ncbi:ABC transporter substrate-binding protein [Ureibacillus acetophenoni]|uniref:Peptide/nickel transport system substrate-binding protein n=1 Tax=Ureibacillus acetophenoni TaxID=614649 RepID=A0A285UGG3_9BACL|nr:ABC transporter substrate-binding protein [Ureibacillus acetophenoni]SOC40892.1 peptide/nickel transport system substrate-binding protein [Ureibacillus acetophenoni]